jgi:hypothetical protein
MGKYISIQIPTTCHEGWDNMTANAQGRYCNSCEKTVIDFTGMTDTQLANFFKSKAENTCGRFYADQLNTDIAIPKKEIPWLKYFFTITLPAFLFSQKSNGQSKIESESSILMQTKEIKKDSTVLENNERHLEGTITDENGKTIPYASIMFVGTKIGISADENGNFVTKLKKNQNNISISAVGYFTKIIDVTNVAILPPTMLKPRLELYNSGVIVVTKRKKKSFKKIEPIFENKNPINIYPNPISSNSKLNIFWKNNISNSQQIEIFNASGVLIQKEIVAISFTKTNSSFIILKQMPAGFYIIKIIDTKTRQTQSKEFIVN